MFSTLVRFLEDTGAAGPFTSTTEFPSPAAWNDLPEASYVSYIEEIVLTGPEAASALTQLDGYELNLEAFRDYWLRFLYGGWYEHPSPGDVAAADAALEHLQYLRQVLAAGSRAEWLLVCDL